MCNRRRRPAPSKRTAIPDRLKRWAALSVLAALAAFAVPAAHGAASSGFPESTGTAAAEDLFADEFEDGDGLLDDDPPPEPPLLAMVNRLAFGFNDVLYFAVTKPVVSAYRALVPLTVRNGVRRFFSNLWSPVRAVNALLQGKGQVAEAELVRFVMNTTVGVLGFGDPAGRFDHLNPPAEDLGQTLGFHGVGEGFFIVWPVLGPSTLRDTVGMAGDGLLHPFSLLYPGRLYWALKAHEQVNGLSFRIGDYESLKEASIEPYAAVRDAYIQVRRNHVKE